MRSLTLHLKLLIAILVVLDGRLDAPATRWARDALTWIAVALTIYSGLAYIRLAWPSLRESNTPA